MYRLQSSPSSQEAHTKTTTGLKTRRRILFVILTPPARGGKFARAGAPGMKGRSNGYNAGVKTTHSRRSCADRPRERGNIVLVSALIVLALGLAGAGLTRLLQTQLSMGAELRRSNFAGTHAQLVAESLINHQLYLWNTSQLPDVATGMPSAAAFSQLADLAVQYEGYTAMTSATGSLDFVGPGWSGGVPSTRSLQAWATVTVPDSGVVTRRVTVTVAAGTQYEVTGYQR